MIFFCFHRRHLKVKHPDNYKKYLTCKSTVLVLSLAFRVFFQCRIATIQKCVVRQHFTLLQRNALLRIVFLYRAYTTHGTQNILLTHVLVCWFTVLVLVLSLNVLVLVLYCEDTGLPVFVCPASSVG